MKGDKIAKRTSFGNIVRKRFYDITNSQPQLKSSNQNEKPSTIDPTAKDHIERLIKENLALVKQVADKNKIVEFTGLELQKLRISFEKMKLQNWNLAQSNSHMLAELNLGKQKLKSLQHELGCKDALLKAKTVQLKEKPELSGQKNGSKEGEEAPGLAKLSNDKKPNNRRRPARSQSLGHATTSLRGSEKETAGNKRRCLRRQSASYKPQTA